MDVSYAKLGAMQAECLPMRANRTRGMGADIAERRSWVSPLPSKEPNLLSGKRGYVFDVGTRNQFVLKSFQRIDAHFR
jgi:hypothetical protein